MQQGLLIISVMWQSSWNIVMLTSSDRSCMFNTSSSGPSLSITVKSFVTVKSLSSLWPEAWRRQSHTCHFAWVETPRRNFVVICGCLSNNGINSQWSLQDQQPASKDPSQRNRRHPNHRLQNSNTQHRHHFSSSHHRPIQPSSDLSRRRCLHRVLRCLISTTRILNRTDNLLGRS